MHGILPRFLRWRATLDGRHAFFVSCVVFIFSQEDNRFSHIQVCSVMRTFSQGDGEVSFCGAIEMAGFLDIRCTVIKGGMQCLPVVGPSKLNGMCMALHIRTFFQCPRQRMTPKSETRRSNSLQSTPFSRSGHSSPATRNGWCSKASRWMRTGGNTTWTPQ